MGRAAGLLGTLVMVIVVGGWAAVAGGSTGSWRVDVRGGEEVGVQEPGIGELLIAPPAGAEYLLSASAAESAGGGDGDASSWSTDGAYESESARTYVFLTPATIEEVVGHFDEASMESPHYVDMMDVFEDRATGALDVEAEPAAPLPPDAMEEMIEGYRARGVLTDAEAEEALSEMAVYRRLYPVLKDVTVRSVSFTIEEDPEGRDEYRYVDVDVVRPYIDPAALEVRDGTAILYEVHRMVRQD